MVGLLRLTEPGGSLLQANDPADERWYSRDVAAIAAARGLPGTAARRRCGRAVFHRCASRPTPPPPARLAAPRPDRASRFSNNHLRLRADLVRAGGDGAGRRRLRAARRARPRRAAGRLASRMTDADRRAAAPHATPRSRRIRAGRKNLQQLIQLRWLAVGRPGGHHRSSVHFGLGIALPLRAMLTAARRLSLFNVASWLRCARRAARDRQRRAVARRCWSTSPC